MLIKLMVNEKGNKINKNSQMGGGGGGSDVYNIQLCKSNLYIHCSKIRFR